MKVKETQKPQYNMWQNTLYMIKIAWKYSKSIFFHIPILVVLATLENLAELFIVPSILNSVETKVPLNHLTFLVLGFVLVLVFTNGLQTYVDYLTKAPYNAIRSRINNMLETERRTMSYPYIESSTNKKLYGDAQISVRSNWDATQAIWTTLTDLLKAIVGCLIYIVLLSHIHVSLILMICITSVISFYASKHFNEWEFRHKEEQSEYDNQCFYAARQAQNRKLAKDLRIFGMQSWLKELHAKGLQLTYAFKAKCAQQEFIADSISFFLSFIRNGIAYTFLILQLLNPDMSAAEFLLYFNAIRNFTTWVSGILTHTETLHKQSLDLCRLREFLELPEPFLFEEGESLLPDATKDYEITLQNVSFLYPESENYIFRNLNLTIHAGEKLAIIGLNGAGKTTLVKLICGLYDPTEGEVLLNGVNIKQYNRRDYYKHFSAVFQQFSGGETQRLMLARALYKDAPILVLDEPTAALDPIAEAEIYSKFDAIAGDKTAIYISHRLSSCRFCDDILVFHEGNVVQQGSHDTLVANTTEKYYELWNAQAQYYV